MSPIEINLLFKDATDCFFFGYIVIKNTHVHRNYKDKTLEYYLDTVLIK